MDEEEGDETTPDGTDEDAAGIPDQTHRHSSEPGLTKVCWYWSVRFTLLSFTIATASPRRQLSPGGSSGPDGEGSVRLCASRALCDSSVIRISSA